MIKKWFLAVSILFSAQNYVVFCRGDVAVVPCLDVSKIKFQRQRFFSSGLSCRRKPLDDVSALKVALPNRAVSSGAKQDFKLDVSLMAELDQYMNSQWKQHQHAWVPRAKDFSKKKKVAKDPQAIFFYSHGYAGSRKYSESDAALAFCPIESALRNFTYCVCHPGLDYSKKFMSFAQGYDVYQVDRHLVRLINERNTHCPDVHIICVAHSNGASTLISALCKNPYLAQHIDGVVLLAPYADIAEVSRVKRIARWGGEGAARKAITLLRAPNYDKAAPSPVQLVEQGNYPLRVPTLLVHALLDPLVTYNNFEMFEKAFKIKNRNVAFLTLKNSSKEDAHYFRRLSKEFRDHLGEFVGTVLAQPTTCRASLSTRSTNFFGVLDKAFSGPG